MEIDKLYKIGDMVYFLLNRGDSVFLACGRIVSVRVLDPLNACYIVEGKQFCCELYDSKVFADPKELIRNLCSVVIS